jgi:hypothetical protein
MGEDLDKAQRGRASRGTRPKPLAHTYKSAPQTLRRAREDSGVPVPEDMLGLPGDEARGETHLGSRNTYR